MKIYQIVKRSGLSSEFEEALTFLGVCGLCTRQ